MKYIVQCGVRYISLPFPAFTVLQKNEKGIIMGKRDIQISKCLSYLLRHGAPKEHLPIDVNGYVALETLLSHNRLKSYKCTVEDVHRIVENDAKQRFHIKVSPYNGQELICATQGHSIRSVEPTEEVLHEVRDPKELPPKLIHGTNVHNAILILQSGSIKKLGRNHVHLSPGITGVDAAVVSGMRVSSDVHIYIKIGTVLLNELRVYKSLNNVYLIPDDLPIALFDKLTIRLHKNREKQGKELSRLLQLLQERQIYFELIEE